uniref:Uncharacterized protein LOC111114550 isoform X1 n=1 Tax=Crassostrea virginica TaxID=6565 RepID=A0A8B8BYZ0_CRAVI|nr:uncharacterized protein LOC111114550 isoform X1 [Crassostrea virginica]
MLHYIVLSGILIRLCLGFEIQLLENLEWFTANRTCSETLSGGLLTPSDALMDRSLEIATPTSQNYWSDKKATITDFIQFEGCFNSSIITKRETLMPWQHPITACFELCENTTRIGLMTKDIMDVDCVCLGEEDITSSRENITNCFMSCPNDPLMNSCGNLQLMSVYNRLKFDAPSLRNMAECVAVTTDDVGAVTLQFDDCQNTNDGYICEICDAEQCSQKVVQEETAVTWQEAQEACQNQGGYLGNLGSAKAKTIWTGHRRWLLEDRYSVFGTYCLMCNYTNGILRSVCQYTNCSEERPSLCVKDSEKIPVRSWFEAKTFCKLSSSRLLNGEELLEKKVNDSIYISHYYWTNGVAKYTPYVRTIGCFDISNSSGMFPLNHTIEGPGRDCIQQCQTTDFLGLTTDGMAFQCFCLEHFKNLSQFNTTECMMSCTQEIDDLCSGEDGRLIVYEIDRNSVGSSFLESEMECLSFSKQMDFMSMDSTDCLQKATGYICEMCDTDRNNCTQKYYVGSYNWLEASMECRDKGGNLGNLFDYDITVDGTYWFGGRRWRVEQNTTEDAVPSDSSACQRCRINNGQLQCNYAICNGNSLPGMCLGGIVDAKTTLTTDAITEKPTSTYDVVTGSSRHDTIPVHITENLLEFTEFTESTKSTTSQHNDDMNANVIAIVIVLLIIGGVVVGLVVTKLRKGEKVTSDVSDLICTKNGPTKFTDLRDSASRPSSAHHMPVERQRSFSNPSFMDHDVDILAHNMEHDSHPDTVELDNER